MNALHRLHELGQSIWYDNIRRTLLTSGELARYLEEYAVTGVTSNPTIFERAMASGTDYDEAIRDKLATGDAERIEALFFALAVEDIAAAADVLRGIYDRSGGSDGFVSLEVSPDLAHDTSATVEAARRLFAAVGRSNVMIKVPATDAGIGSVTMLIADGIPVNVTLIFSVSQYRKVAEAYLQGLEQRLAVGREPKVASVASVFVSRWDSAVDNDLPETRRGRLGIANARLVHAAYRQVLATDRWHRLAAAGARPQRVLWASTGVKDPQMADTLYVAALAAPDTVNTMPEATMLAFADHGRVEEVLGADPGDAHDILDAMRGAGIDVEQLADELLAQGLNSFASSFKRLLENLHAKVDALRQEGGARERLAGLAQNIRASIDDLAFRGTPRRIWSRDHTFWQDDPAEVADRLGWLDCPSDIDEKVAALDEFVAGVRESGLTHAVVLGMGGSSLFPEVLAETFPPREGFLTLRVLDTTDPAAILRLGMQVPLHQTLFIASSKSGSTLETSCHLAYFWEQTGGAADRFCVVTDPGSELAAAGSERRFRKVWLADPHIGGRYSALSWFGLVPAALLGVDVAELLHRAGHLAAAAAMCVPAPDNPGVRLGAALGAAAKAGRDKLTLALPEGVATFGLWLEQLIAESTGKRGTGIVPVAGEPLGAPEVYGEDRLFVGLGSHPALDELAGAGHPVVELPFGGPYDLGGEVFRWEFATAVAGAVLGINPFDQPNVAEAKAATNRVLADGLPNIETVALQTLLDQVRPGDYLSIQAYIDPESPALPQIEAARVALRDRYRVATTVGLGPRFLHSTGQLHKGGPPTGVFVQIVGGDGEEVPIPGRKFGFSRLKQAQAAGDLETLRAHGLRAGRVDLDELLSAADAR